MSNHKTYWKISLGINNSGIWSKHMLFALWISRCTVWRFLFKKSFEDEILSFKSWLIAYTALKIKNTAMNNN